MSNSKNNTEDIYFLVPGFLGNFSEGLFSDLYNFLISEKENVEKCIFRGHEESEIQLDSIDKMTKFVFYRFLDIRRANPNKNIIIIAHSQGTAIVAKLVGFLDINTIIILLSPVVYISEMLNHRISKNNLEKIDAGKSVKCELAQNKYGIINKKWVDSYRNFHINEKDLCNLKQRFLIIRPTNDYIPKKNFEVLKNNISNVTCFEIEGDHIFKNPKNSSEKLIEKITMWINKK